MLAPYAGMSLLRPLHRVLFVASVIAIPSSASGQMPGQPVIQNAFANPGLGVGVNYGDSDEALGYGAAVGFGTASGKLGLSGGLGIWDPANAESVFAWGARAMWAPLRFLEERLAAGVYAGIGGARQNDIDVIAVPVGIMAGFRTALTETRGISFYASPFLRLSRADFGGGAGENTWLFRGSVGVDVAVHERVGITVGYEFGATADPGEPGPTGGTVGLGVSYVLGTRDEGRN